MDHGSIKSRRSEWGYPQTLKRQGMTCSRPVATACVRRFWHVGFPDGTAVIRVVRTTSRRVIRTTSVRVSRQTGCPASTAPSMRSSTARGISPYRAALSGIGAYIRLPTAWSTAATTPSRSNGWRSAVRRGTCLIPEAPGSCQPGRRGRSGGSAASIGSKPRPRNRGVPWRTPCLARRRHRRSTPPSALRW